MPQQEAIAQPEPVPVEYPEIRAAYRALRDGTASREDLLAIGDKLEANAIYEPDENGAQQLVGFRGKIPKAASNVVYEAAKAARESDDPAAWGKAAKLDEIQGLSFSQAKTFVKALKAGESYTTAVTDAIEAPKEEPIEVNQTENADTEDESTSSSEEKGVVAADPVNEAIKQARSVNNAKLKETIEGLDPEQLETVVAKLADDLSESIGASPESTTLEPLVAAKGIDAYLEKYTIAGTSESVQELHRAVVRTYLDRVAQSNPEALSGIVEASSNSFIRENYKAPERHEATVETRRELIAQPAGDVAVGSQLPNGDRHDRYGLAA